MSSPPLLTALLASVTGDLGQIGGIADLTVDRVAAPWIPEGAASVRPAGLVICELVDLDVARGYRLPEGMILARSSRVPDQGSPLAADPELELISSVRDGAHSWHLLVERSSSPDPLGQIEPTQLDASVVVVTRDQARALYRFLTMLSVEPAETRWEVIVADRSSFDETADLLRAVEGDLRVIDLPRSSSSAEALHRAMALARAPLLVVADVDGIPAPAFVRAAVRGAAAAPPTQAWFAGPEQLQDRPTRLFALRRSAWSPAAAPREAHELVAQLRHVGPAQVVKGLVSRPPRA